MSDIDKLARTIKEDAANSGVVEDVEKAVRPEEYAWYVREFRRAHRMLGGGSDE